MFSWILEKFLEFSGFVSIALAQRGNPIRIEIKNPLRCSDFGCVAKNIIIGLKNLAIPVVSIMVLVGAFQILFSAGNPEKLKTGKKTILYSVVGFAVIIIADGVVDIIRSLFK